MHRIMGRAIGIDYGAKRTGIAVTDPLRISVNPLGTIQTEELEPYLIQYLKKEPVDLIVLGDPYHKDGTPTDLSKSIHLLGDWLKKTFTGTDVRYVDERNTSVRAVEVLVKKGTPKSKRNKEAIDQMSAILILQKYLNHI
ncbi:MAG: Holliday junction resolvase RuvX [Saprospiraceae bacterium]